MWLQLVYAVVMMIVSYAIQAATAPKPKNAVAGQLDTPTATEGECIPVVFGTVLRKETNIIWYGNAFVVPIKSKGGKK